MPKAAPWRRDRTRLAERLGRPTLCAGRPAVACFFLFARPCPRRRRFLRQGWAARQEGGVSVCSTSFLCWGHCRLGMCGCMGRDSIGRSPRASSAVLDGRNFLMQPRSMTKAKRSFSSPPRRRIRRPGQEKCAVQECWRGRRRGWRQRRSFRQGLCPANRRTRGW